MGQHFLISQKIAEKTASAADISSKDIILEIGPGKGILTKELIKKAGRVIAVEKDRRLFEYLQKKFSGDKKLESVCADIRDFLKNRWSKLKIKNYKVGANIPYYITSHLLRLLLEEAKIKPKKIVLMVQKEVSQRICARPPKMSLLSLSVQAFGKPKIVFYVKKGNFSPQPKVDSAVIAIDSISNDFFVQNKITPKKFFEFLRLGFSQKRKILANNLARKYPRSAIENAFIKCGLNSKSRAQELALNNWLCVIKNKLK